MPLHRLRSILATGALAAVFAAAVLPGAAGSQTRTPIAPVDPALLQPIHALGREAASAASSTLDPAYRSEGALHADAIVGDPATDAAPPTHGRVDLPDTSASVIVIPSWRWDPEISWYGPGFYGNRTACGHTYTREILGVAHRSLPCGTRVTFRHGSRVITVPVIDRGPYVSGRIFDLSRAACVALNHCFTGPIQYKIP
jgi:hypothetical protein